MIYYSMNGIALKIAGITDLLESDLGKNSCTIEPFIWRISALTSSKMGLLQKSVKKGSLLKTPKFYSEINWPLIGPEVPIIPRNWAFSIDLSVLESVFQKLIFKNCQYSNGILFKLDFYPLPIKGITGPIGIPM